MFYYLRFFVIFFSLLLSACTATQFGVPVEQWQQMNDEQKRLAIEGYNQRQLIREQRRLEQSRADAILQQQQLELDRRKEHQHQKRIHRIRHGEGVLGDLVRVSILSCQAKLHSKYRQINPVSITLADGERRNIKISSITHKKRSYKSNLPIKYTHRLITIGGRSSGKKGIKLAYEHSWLKGRHYHRLSAKEPIRLQECEIAVSVIPTQRHRK